MVLIFNGAQVLVAVTRSLHSAAELTKGNLQAISFCCTGKYVCSGGLYFRHLHPDVASITAMAGRDSRCIDDRNRASYEMCQMLASMLEDTRLPFI